MTDKPCFISAEVGMNHNGSVDTADALEKQLSGPVIEPVFKICC